MLNQKLVSVGDGRVGKTCVFKTYIENKYDITYVSPDYSNATPIFTVDGQEVMVGVLDISSNEAGHRLFDHMRHHLYLHTDIFFVCFSVDDKVSFKNVEDKWIPEIRHHCPDVPFIIVACKIDLRWSSSGKDMISYDQGLNLAKKYGVRYCETSAKAEFGLKNAFEEAIRSKIAYDEACIQKYERVSQLGIKPRHAIPDPPVLPEKDSAPTVEIETSTFGDDWHRALQDPRHSDVTFVLEDMHRLPAHSVMLCSASKMFANVFSVTMPTVNKKPKQIDETESYSREQINTGAVPGFAAIYDKEPEVKGEGHVQTVIEMSADISAKTFIHVLEFLYSGTTQFTKDTEDTAEDEIRDVDRVASLLNLSQLQAFCCNMLTDKEYLNPSITMAHNDETGARMKELFFNKEEKADVVFLVEGEKVYSHKCVLTTRCQVMAAMLSGHFAESQSDPTKVTIPNTTQEMFLALLEYLYTDHAPIDDLDPMELLVLSDEFGHRRLTNFCEFYITKEIERSVTMQEKKTEMDVIGVLLTAQTHNADQLAKWCLFFIASNYTAFENRKEFPMLKGDNKDYVEENRWPPVSYLKAMEEYQSKYGEKKDGKCVVI